MGQRGLVVVDRVRREKSREKSRSTEYSVHASTIPLRQVEMI